MRQCAAQVRGPTGILWRCTRPPHGPEPEMVERMVYGHLTTFTMPSAHWFRAVSEEDSHQDC